MEHPKEGPGSPGNAVSPLKTLWKCLSQTFRSVLWIRGAGEGSGAVTACPRWDNPRTWGSQGAWAVPDGSPALISPLPAAQSRFEMCASHWVLSWLLSLLLTQRSHQGRVSPGSRGREVAPSVPSEMFLGRKLGKKTTLANVWVIFGIDGAIWLQLCKGSPFFTLSLWVLSCRVVQSLLKTVPKCQTWKDTAL